MNPTSNKKDFEELTTNLRDSAYAYLEKYSPSKQQLKIYLLKKYLTKFNNSKSKKDLSNIIEKVLINLEKNKLISDLTNKQNLTFKNPLLIYSIHFFQYNQKA